jgi:hypothetical protein
MMMRLYDRYSPPNAPPWETLKPCCVRLVWVPFVKYLNIFKQRLLEDVSGSQIGEAELLIGIEILLLSVKILFEAKKHISDVKRDQFGLNTRGELNS